MLIVHRPPVVHLSFKTLPNIMLNYNIVLLIRKLIIIRKVSQINSKYKSEGKVRPRTGHEGPEVE